MRVVGIGVGLLVLISGCSTVPVATPPQIVTVTHYRYLPIPAALLLPCLIPVGIPPINSDLLLHDQAAMVDLLGCQAQINQIKALKPPK